MSKNFCAFGMVVIGAWMCLATSMAQGQYPQAARFYEQGVNSYFAGRSGLAEMYLSRAIEFGSQDPRTYYFRAFCLLRHGRCAEARGDMFTGAQLEAQYPNRYAIGSALERIQGHDRLVLEEIRRDARATIGTASPPAAVVPGQLQTAPAGDAGVLRQQRVVPLEELLRPGGPQSVPVEPPAEAPPIPPQAVPPAAPPGQPSARPAPAEENPFGDDPGVTAPEAAPPATTPPQATSPQPAVTPPQETPQPTPPATPPAAEENPFNG
jgi:hypothetical protein